MAQHVVGDTGAGVTLKLGDGTTYSYTIGKFSGDNTIGARRPQRSWRTPVATRVSSASMGI
ncbi:hypothetical protein ACOJBO_00580 [Rhizobium beringeri]